VSRGETRSGRWRGALERVRRRFRDPAPAEGDAPYGLYIDRLLRLENGFFMLGWMYDGRGDLSLHLESADGTCTCLTDRVCRVDRPEVTEFCRQRGGGEVTEKLGFIGFISDSTALEASSLSLRANGHTMLKVPLPRANYDVSSDPYGARRELLGVPEPAFSDELALRDHLHPSFEAVQKWCARKATLVDSYDVGRVPEEGAATIIIPVYGGTELIEYQLALFAGDPEFREQEIIYVLDSPDLAEGMKEVAAQWSSLYEIPFRVIVANSNLGYGIANNLAAKEAKRPLLLFLNNDVFPVRPGWVGELARFYRSKQDLGALGAKLLREDNSLQHAGIFYSDELSADGQWWILHEHKGFERSLPLANATMVVPAVTGACLMIQRELFAEVGGFSHSYVIGDFEDSDLCLRLLSEGRENWYVHSPELYHLEGGSYPEAIRRKATRYNRWLHTRRWDREIRELMLQRRARLGSEAIAES
jgi:GT2 family glycosyltransferase